MQNQATDTASVTDETSTIDDIKALAPLTEEWLRAKSRQFAAGKQLAMAEWALLKKSLLVVTSLLLLFTSLITVFLLAVNITIAYGLVLAEFHWLAIASIVLALNLLLIVLCVTTVKRVGSNISFSLTKQMVTGKGELTEDSDDD